MPSPFPGMDPYLEEEKIWPTFHHHFIACLYQILLPGLVDKYRARVSQRHYVTEQALFTSIIREEHHEEYIEIRQRSDGRLVTMVDVVSPGQPMLEYSREGLPDWDYAVTVTRSTQPDRFEIYTATLQKRLPRFRLPLASYDRDTVVDLYTIFTRSFDQGSFAAKINYQRDPAISLTEEKLRWLDEWLKQQ